MIISFTTLPDDDTYICRHVLLFNVICSCVLTDTDEITLSKFNIIREFTFMFEQEGHCVNSMVLVNIETSQ